MVCQALAAARMKDRMAEPQRERPRKIDARKALYAGLRPARMMFGGDAASAPLLQSMGIIKEETHQVWVDGSRQQADNGTRLGIKPISILNAITKWVPSKHIRDDLSFDFLNLDIGETFPVSLGRWLEKNASSIADDSTILLWVARQFRNQEMLTFHDWFDAFWRGDKHLVQFRKRLTAAVNVLAIDNITLNTMLLLACALNTKQLDFKKAFFYVDGWSMVGISAEVSKLPSPPYLPSFTEITTNFYANIPLEEPQQNMSDVSTVRKGPKKLSRDVIMSDLNVFLGLLSAINLSLVYFNGIWFLTDRIAQEELYQTSSLENMRVFISGMTIGQTSYLPRL